MLCARAGLQTYKEICGEQAFDLIEHDGEDLRNYPFLDRKSTLARLLRY
jgi:hypothetical protein